MPKRSIALFKQGSQKARARPQAPRSLQGPTSHRPRPPAPPPGPRLLAAQQPRLLGQQLLVQRRQRRHLVRGARALGQQRGQLAARKAGATSKPCAPGTMHCRCDGSPAWASCSPWRVGDGADAAGMHAGQRGLNQSLEDRGTTRTRTRCGLSARVEEGRPLRSQPHLLSCKSCAAGSARPQPQPKTCRSASGAPLTTPTALCGPRRADGGGGRAGCREKRLAWTKWRCERRG